MKFYVQTINKIPAPHGYENDSTATYYEIDLVDAQLDSDWQSSITLRVPAKAAKFYHIGQAFSLKLDEYETRKHTEEQAAYFAVREHYVVEEE
jgi:hypothetical protein